MVLSDRFQFAYKNWKKITHTETTNLLNSPPVQKKIWTLSWKISVSKDRKCNPEIRSVLKVLDSQKNAIIRNIKHKQRSKPFRHHSGLGPACFPPSPPLSSPHLPLSPALSGLPLGYLSPYRCLSTSACLRGTGPRDGDQLSAGKPWRCRGIGATRSYKFGFVNYFSPADFVMFSEDDYPAF